MSALPTTEDRLVRMTGSSDQESQPQDGPGGSGAMRKHLTSGMLALVDQGFVSLNTFVTLMLVVQFCSREEVSLYALAWSILNIFRVLQERLLAAPYLVFAHEKDRDRRTFLGSSLSHQACLGAITSVGFVLLALGFSLYGQPAGFSACMWSLVVAAPLILLRDHLRAVSCAHLQYYVALFLSATAFLLQVLLIVSLYSLQVLNIPVVILAIGVSSLIPCLVWIVWRPQPFRMRVGRVQEDWRTISNFSRWLVAARFFPTAANSLLPWIVLWNVGQDAPGVLAACLSLASVSMMFVLGANSFFQPRAVRALHQDGKPGLLRVLIESAAVFGVVLSALCGFYVMLGDRALVLIFGPEFSSFGPLVSVLGLNVLIVSMSVVAGNGMAAMRQPKGLFWGELSFGIATVLLAFLFSWQFGLMGAAIGACCGSLVATIVEAAILIYLLNVSTEALATS